MATLTATKFNCFWEDVMHGVHDLSSDQLKMALSNVAPTAATDDEFADITEISAGDGYTAGGGNVTRSSSSQSSGTYTYVGSGTVAWTSTGTIGPFQYPVLYNADAANDELIAINFGHIDFYLSLINSMPNSPTKFEGSDSLLPDTAVIR